MIPQPPLKQQQQHLWRQALREMITDPLELLGLLELVPSSVPWQWDKNFPLRVTKSYVDRMRKGDPNDPLLKQILSIDEESQIVKNYTTDPLKEANYNPVPGILHKFHGRALVTFSTSCAIHCRYCFRRHFPYENNNPGRKGWSEALHYLQQHPEIFEVILSGGDPLMALDETIELFLQQLVEIPHITWLRIHTRLPVVIPERISDHFLKMLQRFQKKHFNIVMVYHINHPAEIIPEITQGVTALKQLNITVLNQSVLLAGINDNLDCLKTLSLRLFESGIMPYYLNLLDTVQGSSHFAISHSQAKELQHQLRSQLPGFLLPSFVKDIPGQAYKIPLDLIPSF